MTFLSYLLVDKERQNYYCAWYHMKYMVTIMPVPMTVCSDFLFLHPLYQQVLHMYRAALL